MDINRKRRRPVINTPGMSMFIQRVFYNRHVACMQSVCCMQGVDVVQSSVDPVPSDIDALHAACMSIVKYAYSVKVALD